MQEETHPGQKLCNGCNPPQWKRIDEFYKHKGCRDGHINICKECHVKDGMKRYHEMSQEEKDRRGTVNDIWRKNNPDNINVSKAKSVAKRISNGKIFPERRRAALRRYGLTEEQYNLLVEKQKGKCAICKTPGSESRFGKLDVDHDHTSGNFVRGLLCHRCNTAIGLFRESPEILSAAINYLENAGLFRRTAA